MFFNSIKEINRLRKEVNRLLSKRMSIIYLKVTIEKKWRTQNFDYKNWKSSSSGQFLRSGSKTVCGLSTFYYFYFERNYDVLKSNSPCFLLNKNIEFDKNKTESKMENPTHSLGRWTMSFSSYKNCKSNVMN